MKTWRSFMAGGKRLAVRIELVGINTVRIFVSVPCRNGQYVILDCNNESFFLSYDRGKCIVCWVQNTRQFSSISDLLTDISTWFKYRYAIRLENDESIYTIKEIYNSL